MKQLLWFLPFLIVFLFIAITIFVMNKEKLPPKSELFSLDGYLW